MAAGSVTISYGPTPVGNQDMYQGYIEVDDTYRAFAILPTTSYIASFQAMDSEGTGSIEVDLNVNASGTDTNGTVAVVGNHATTNTYYFTCLCFGR